MSNRSVIERLRELVDNSEPVAFGNGSFERAVEFHMEALEGIGLDETHRARDLAFRLSETHFLDGDEEFGSPVSAAQVRFEFHEFLDDLARRP